MTIKEAAAKWNLTEFDVLLMCQEHQRGKYILLKSHKKIKLSHCIWYFNVL